MNTSSPDRWRHFHPAWLLLPVAPLLGMATDSLVHAATRDFGRLLQFGLLGGTLAGIGILRAAAGTGPGLRILKELRLQLPAALLGLLGPALLTCHVAPEMTPWAVGSHVVGTLFLAAGAFGTEFEQRTLAGLLAEPVGRGRIFLEKLGVAAALIGLSWGSLRLALGTSPDFGFTPADAQEVAWVPVFAVCSAPLFSLLSRSTLAGMVFTATVPGVLFLAGSLALLALHRALGMEGSVRGSWVDRMLLFGPPIYLAATALLGWRAFVRLRLADGGVRGAASLHPLSLPVDRLLRAVLPARHPLGHLLRKELRLHVVPWLVAGILVGLALLGAVLRASVRPGSPLHDTLHDVPVLAVFGGLLGSIVLIAAGAACCAEERELGTLEWQLTQPASFNRQWRVKLLTAVVLAAALGAALPAALIWLSFDKESLGRGFGDTPAVAVAAYSGFFIVLFVVSVYASSISRSTMKATAAAVGIGGGLGAWMSLIGAGLVHLMERIASGLESSPPFPVVAPPWAPSPELLTRLGIAAVATTGLLLAIALLELARTNTRSGGVPGRNVLRQLVGIGAGVAVLMGLEGYGLIQLVRLRLQAEHAVNEASNGRVDPTGPGRLRSGSDPGAHSTLTGGSRPGPA